METITSAHSIDLAGEAEYEGRLEVQASDTLLSLVQTQHYFNCALWAQEDIGRSAHLTDTELAKVKRRIDRLNQHRNDWIELVNEYFTTLLTELSTRPKENARLNSETVGSVIDRLSILSQRIRSLTVIMDESREAKMTSLAQERLSVCLRQRTELRQSLRELLQDICDGQCIHYCFRTMKLYNDPRFNKHMREDE